MRGSSAAKKLEEESEVFAALGDATRWRLVRRLCENGPLSIVRLTSGTDVTRQAVAKHLRVLENAGLVRADKEGRERIWTLEEKRLELAQRALTQVAKRWDDALLRLKHFVEN